MTVTHSQSGIAYQRIRDAVVSGEFQAGQLLPESQLAIFCGVSRTPVRDALKRLETERLVTNVDRSWQITDPQPEEIYAVYETKAILESANASLAAQRRTELDLVLLTQQVERAENLKPTDPLPELLVVNHEFATLLWKASHNESLTEVLARIGTPHVRFGGRSTLEEPGQWVRAQRYFRQVLEAVKSRDAHLAGELARAQTETVRDIRIMMRRTHNSGLHEAISHPA